MTSARKIQLGVLLSIFLLMLFLGTRPIKGLINPKEDTEKTAEAAFNADKVLNDTKKIMKPSELNEIERLENSNQNAALAQTYLKFGYPAASALILHNMAEQSQQTTDQLRAAEALRAAFKTTNDSINALGISSLAIENYQKVLAVDSTNITAKIGLASCYVEGSNNPMQGIQMLLGIVAKEPLQYDANMALGLFSMKSGQFAKAVERFENAAQSKADAEVYFYLAESAKEAGDKQKAIKAYENCIELLPDENTKAQVRNYLNELLTIKN